MDAPASAATRQLERRLYRRRAPRCSGLCAVGLVLVDDFVTILGGLELVGFNERDLPHHAEMAGAGFEPAKAEPSDLQSDPFDRSGIPPGRR